MITPSCPLQFTDPPDAWRQWVRTITPEQLVECRGKLMRESINVVSPTIAKAIGGIVGVIDAEYCCRFPDLVAQVAGLRADLSVTQTERDAFRQQLAGNFETEAEA